VNATSSTKIRYRISECNDRVRSWFVSRRNGQEGIISGCGLSETEHGVSESAELGCG